MNIVPEHVTGISHPMVREIYLKKDFGNGGLKHEDVLVIETMPHEKSGDNLDYESFDSYLIDILADLDDLKMQAQSKVGHFDRVDIRSH